MSSQSLSSLSSKDDKKEEGGTSKYETVLIFILYIVFTSSTFFHKVLSNIPGATNGRDHSMYGTVLNAILFIITFSAMAWLMNIKFKKD